MVNKATGYTIVGGHQKVSVLDELNKYNEVTLEGDYTLRVELIEVDLKTEKELNITLNNHRVGGDWDYDALREIMPEVDYSLVGFTDEDLSIIGVDYIDPEDLPEVDTAVIDLYGETKSRKTEEQEELEAPQTNEVPYENEGDTDTDEDKEIRVTHMKEVKKQVREKAEERAKDLNAYVVISFDSFEAKAEFCEMYGYDILERFIKGEKFVEQLEGIE